MTALTVLATGPLATVQDHGRPGLARWGISPSGAADQGALALGNRLVGNPAGTAGIEATLGGLSLRAGRPCVVVLTGADTHATVDGRPIGLNSPVAVPAGATLAMATPEYGLRSYVCVRGGIDVPVVLGSRSRDVLAALGPAPLQSGDRLTVGPAEQPMPSVDWAPTPAPTPADLRLACRAGPRMDWFTPDSHAALTTASWAVSNDVDRIGVRLTGPALERVIEDELPSEGLVRGAVQVPANGQPLIFLADHPTTGGYPVIAVVEDTDAVAQLRPGQILRFRWRAETGAVPPS